jgi:hypothetical protein
MTHLSLPAHYKVRQLGRIHTQPVFTQPAA